MVDTGIIIIKNAIGCGATEPIYGRRGLGRNGRAVGGGASLRPECRLSRLAPLCELSFPIKKNQKKTKNMKTFPPPGPLIGALSKAWCAWCGGWVTNHRGGLGQSGGIPSNGDRQSPYSQNIA